MATATTTAQAEAAAKAAAALQAQYNTNWRALAYGRKAEVLMPPQIGSGPGQTYSLGSTLVWNLPTINGGFAEDIVLYFNVTLNFAAGTGATYALNASAPFSLAQKVTLLYGQTQISIPLFILRNWFQLYGYGAPTIGSTLGNQDATIQALLYNSPFGVAAGNQTWTFYCTIPLRWLTRNVAGMLPIMGGATPGQLQLTVPSGLMGGDPALFPTAALAGTGNAVTVVSGTITAYTRYRDGSNFLSPGQAYAPNLSGLPTLQSYYDSTLQPLQAGIMNPIRIANKEQHFMVFSVIVDAQQSTKYATWANLAGFELDQDYSRKNAFYRYGATAVNLPVYLWHLRNRDMLWNDYVDQGVLPWVTALVENGMDIGATADRTGEMVLDMRTGKYTDATIAVQPTAVGAVGGVTARIDNYVFLENYRGLVKK